MRLRACRLWAFTLSASIFLAGCGAQESRRNEAPVTTQTPASASLPAQDSSGVAGAAAGSASVSAPPLAAAPAPAAAVPDDLKQMQDAAKTDAAKTIDLPKALPGTVSVKQPKRAKAATPASHNSFPWPPPRPSVALTLPRELLWRALSVTDASGFAARRLGDFDTMLSAALDRAGYVQRSYYQMPGGFALATQLERIDDDGKSAAGEARWILGQPQRNSFGLGDYLKALFAAAPGRFRIVVLVVSSMPFTTSDVEPGVDTARAWVTGGMSALPLDIAAQPYGPNGGTQALVYEFEKPPGGSAQVKTPGHISAQGHLAGIQLLTNLAP